MAHSNSKLALTDFDADCHQPEISFNTTMSAMVKSGLTRDPAMITIKNID
jgi:hypothetical protein